jgi:hypothetical protein
MRSFPRTRLGLLLCALAFTAALAPVWLTAAGMAQHSCHCGLGPGCRCELAAAPARGASSVHGGHGHCDLRVKSCEMGRTHVPSDNALFAGLDGRGWYALPDSGEVRLDVPPAGRAVVPAAASPRSLLGAPETPPPRSSGSVV